MSSTRIKVLHVINDLSVGGAETMLYRLLSVIDRGRFESVVLSLKNGGDLREAIAGLGVEIHSLNLTGSITAPSSIWRLLQLLDRTKPDVIQGWLPHSNLVALLAGALSSPRVPVVWNVRQSLESLQSEKLVTKLAIRLGASSSRKPTRIIYNSKSGATQHIEFGYSPENATVIHNGFDTDLFTQSEAARESVRAELGLAPDTLLIGLVSRYHPVKNHANFLRSAAELRKQYPNIRFVLCGNGINWSNEPLSRLISALGLSASVHLLGPRQDIPRITAALDIAASASNSEGFPNAVGEAMSCAVPCVVTDVSDLDWIVKNAGIVVPKNDPAAMTRAFARMIELGQSGRKVYGRNARTRVMERFQLGAIVEQYANLYEGVLAASLSEQRTAPLNSLVQGYGDSAGANNGWDPHGPAAASDTIKAAV